MVVFSAGCGRWSGIGGGNIFRIPWPDEKGIYTLQNVSIESYDNPAMLQGRHAHVMVDPGVRGGGFDQQTPIGRYLRNRDGVYVPLDYISLQAAAVQAHFERLAQLDGELGAQSNWPARIALDMNLLRDDGKRTTDNALFWDELDALLIPPYTGARVPIAANAGILAHEHFHMIFYAMVLRPLGPEGRLIGQTAKDFRRLHALGPMKENAEAGGDTSEEKPVSEEEIVRRYNSLYLTALNEGLADFWGWVYSGDPDFIAASLPREGRRRRIDRPLGEQIVGKPQILTWVGSGNGKPLSPVQLMASAYSVGTSYARALYELTSEVSGEKVITRSARLAVAAAVIKTLPDFKARVEAASRAKETISPNLFLAALYKNLPRSGDAGVCRTFRRITAPDLSGESARVQCGGGRSAEAKAGGQTPEVHGAGQTPAAKGEGSSTPTTKPEDK